MTPAVAHIIECVRTVRCNVILESGIEISIMSHTRIIITYVGDRCNITLFLTKPYLYENTSLLA